MSGNVENIASLNQKIMKIGKNSVGKNGFGAAVGVLSVCVLTAIILGSVSLSESNSSATQNINKITANFDTGDPTNTGVSVNLVGDKYQVSLDYSQGVAHSFINLLQGVSTSGIAQANRVLTLDENMGVSGISTVTSDVFYGQLGSDSPIQQHPAYISGLSVINGSYHNGILVSGDTTTNSVTSPNSALIGGTSNRIHNGAVGSVAVGCCFSSIFEGSNSFIGGGDGNGVSSSFTAILGGKGLNTAPGGSWDYATLCGIRNDPDFYPWDNITSTVNRQGTCYRFAVGAGSAVSSDMDLGFAVDDAGNLYFGDNSGGCSIFVQDTTGYTAKAFTIQHPTINNRWLRHGCLEGPEGGVYYRGKGEAPAIIRLPDYATRIASDFTVQVTPIGLPRLMSASEVTPEGTFRVHGEGRFHWNAIGERVSLDPEPLKTDVTIHSMGPYSWSV